MKATTEPVDGLLPARQLLLYGLQHVRVMAASPITGVFLVSRALKRDGIVRAMGVRSRDVVARESSSVA